jgi:hypothetical protein
MLQKPKEAISIKIKKQLARLVKRKKVRRAAPSANTCAATLGCTAALHTPLARPLTSGHALSHRCTIPAQIASTHDAEQWKLGLCSGLMGYKQNADFYCWAAALQE